MTDVTEDRDQDGAELSAADEQLPSGRKRCFRNQTSRLRPKVILLGRWAEYQAPRAHLGTHCYLFRINPVKRRDFPVNVGVRC